MIPQLAEWESFYIIVGSSGAALIHNAWDTVTYLAVSEREGKDQRGT